MFAFRSLGAIFLSVGALTVSTTANPVGHAVAGRVADTGAVSPAWKGSVIHFFGDTGADGLSPFGGLLQDASGTLYGTASYGGPNGAGIVFKLTPPGHGRHHWAETVLHAFNGSNGADPEAGVIADAHGALYGTTVQGGGCPVFPDGCGTVFKLTPPAAGKTTWTESVLHVFTGADDGALPYAGLISDAYGALYGTTYDGGYSLACGSLGCGTVFKLTPPAPGSTAWTETVLHAFTGVDGAYLQAGLIEDMRGALFGTTLFGGAGGYGTVFRLTPSMSGKTAWTESILHSFSYYVDGGEPTAGVIADRYGALYGSTTAGPGGGTVFKLTPPAPGRTAWSESVLHVFTGGSDGGSPNGVIADARGDLYGTTIYGGNQRINCFGCGTVFKLTPPAAGKTAWAESVLHSFTGADGYYPRAGLTADASGTLYGTTIAGGAHGAGTVFELKY